MDADDSNRTAYRALAIAVLQTALQDLNMARKKRHRSAERKIMQWVESNADTYVFAFVPLCEWLGFDVELMRKQLLSVDNKK